MPIISVSDSVDGARPGAAFLTIRTDHVSRALYLKQVSERYVISPDRAALNADSTILTDDGVDLVHDCVDNLRIVGTYDNGLNKIVERMRQAGVILIRQKINLIAGLPQLGSSEIGIKVRVLK